MPMPGGPVRHENLRCPTCGAGVFVSVAYHDPDPKGDRGDQTGDSFEILTFSCGHEVRGPKLAVADPDRLTVEERTAEETVDRPST
jgi:hypothetical protein